MVGVYGSPTVLELALSLCVSVNFQFWRLLEFDCAFHKTKPREGADSPLIELLNCSTRSDDTDYRKFRLQRTSTVRPDNAIETTALEDNGIYYVRGN